MNEQRPDTEPASEGAHLRLLALIERPAGNPGRQLSHAMDIVRGQHLAPWDRVPAMRDARADRPPV